MALTRLEQKVDVVRSYLWERVDVQKNGASWRNQLRGIARAFRQLVQEHPAAPALLATGSGESEAERRICDIMLASFRSAGFFSETAEILYLQFSHFVLTLVRLTDGRGAAGLQGLHRPCTCVLTSVSRQTPDASVSIIP